MTFTLLDVYVCICHVLQYITDKQQLNKQPNVYALSPYFTVVFPQLADTSIVFLNRKS